MSSIFSALASASGFDCSIDCCYILSSVCFICKKKHSFSYFMHVAWEHSVSLLFLNLFPALLSSSLTPPGFQVPFMIVLSAKYLILKTNMTAASSLYSGRKHFAWTFCFWRRFNGLFTQSAYVLVKFIVRLNSLCLMSVLFWSLTSFD